MLFPCLLVVCLLVNTSALVSPLGSSQQNNGKYNFVSSDETKDGDMVASSWQRRSAIGSILSMGVFLLGSHDATAASQDEIDKENIVKGYKRLSYLLEHWEEKTTNCKIGQTTTFGDNCERTPVIVMEYLGYKSTNDPLFKIDKTLARLGSLVPPDRDIDYLEATENLLQNAEEANSMAFVSSWGEANPGGGKDRVELFIERAKNNIIVSRKSLETVMEILNIKP